MAASREDSEYVTAVASDHEQVTVASSSSVFVTALEEQIERSKSHWSELAVELEEEAAAKIANQEAFKTWQRHPEWSDFFRTFGYDLGIWESAGELEVGEKFAEGGQAKLYHARVKWRRPEINEWCVQNGAEWVLKVFKKGMLVRHLQAQWPHGMLQHHAEKVKLTKLGKDMGYRYKCSIQCATLLEDGRFAFLMVKETEDLRTRIDREMLERSGQGCGPFSKEVAEVMMYGVAEGMDWLHSHNIVHRDLKASNVLFRGDEDGWRCYVADYECSVGVVGTGFWRAPEILQACKDKNVNERSELFTRKSDAYSYAMTCYEILTGKVPYEDDNSITMEDVIGGQRPKVPEFVEDWTRQLLDWCWQSNPDGRPSFGEILTFIEANSLRKYIHESRVYRMKARKMESKQLKSIIGIIKKYVFKVKHIFR